MSDLLNAIPESQRKLLQIVVAVVGIVACVILFATNNIALGVAAIAGLLLAVLLLQPKGFESVELTSEQENEVRALMTEQGDTEAVIRVRELTGAKMRAAYEAVKELRPQADGNPA